LLNNTFRSGLSLVSWHLLFTR